MWTVNDVPGKEPSGSFSGYLSNSVTLGHYWRSTVYLKLIYSEKATIFFEISNLLLSVYTVDKSKVEISQNIVAFSEYTNFN